MRSQSTVEKAGNHNASQTKFLQDLTREEDLLDALGECRSGAVNNEYQHQCRGTASGFQKQRLILVSWCAESVKIKMKMLYSSSLDVLKKRLVGIAKRIQATDLNPSMDRRRSGSGEAVATSS